MIGDQKLIERLVNAEDNVGPDKVHALHVANVRAVDCVRNQATVNLVDQVRLIGVQMRDCSKDVV